MFHIKPETLSVSSDVSYMSLMPSTSTTVPDSKLFETQQKLFLHEYVNGTRLKCKICNGTFFSCKKFNKHVKAEHEIKYICFSCSEVFQDKNLLYVHLHEYHLIHCKYCNRRYGSAKSLEKHVKRDHLNVQNSETFEDVVNKVDEQQGEFYTTETTSSLRGSFKDEFGKTILKCKECENTFKCSIKFRFHDNEIHHYEWLCLACCQRETYDRTRDTPCTLCSKKFMDKIGLRDHFSAKHPRFEFPYTLPQIPPESLKVFIHESIPYKTQFPSQFPSQFPQFPHYRLKCKICEEIFYTHSTFNKHARIHHDYYFLCNYCSQAFPSKSLENKHTKKNHSPYTCQNYQVVNNLKNHCEVNDSINEPDAPNSVHPMITRSKKRKELDEVFCLKLKGTSFDDKEKYEKKLKIDDTDYWEDNIEDYGYVEGYMPGIKSEYYDFNYEYYDSDKTISSEDDDVNF